ncbi:response regulator transcription factor [Bacillus sp. FJAT-49705]|uniref:Response regulator transcription factor n=1 Tax=Cytobacillus citreus TaxID=2833586 RepID=A0ABS5NZ94_9BACI|nr:response regulator transcription factor [Cytobacillus citreus]
MFTENELTDREKEVLWALVQGMNNKEIAENLYISDKKVKIHVR